MIDVAVIVPVLDIFIPNQLGVASLCLLKMIITVSDLCDFSLEMPDTHIEALPLTRLGNA